MGDKPMRKTRAIRALILSVTVVAALWGQSPADRFRMNQIQVLGSHNSYKKAIDPQLFELLMRTNPEAYSSLEYSHIGFGEQLDLGIRKLEIDVVYDPKGGMYAKPLGLGMVKMAGPYDPEGQMMKP